ncbi:FGGY family carbohydrate kinase [Burkholderia ubonensis]|uniref:FGGY family carbohydrate kinase n=1 Tax=Burkholderia ubonensis TaxID=101571 RepID=UPI000757702C|nr:FGGY family carbohydrate kinase [Burkholderia ubonensis]KVG75203.1 carbohydrate kinase [Burkholderia ubonensis]KVH16572.1 carbohydrate kinase [Burkholderia ubonensis]KVH50431.1 carbohydrate kinase [Burkholderia ubonensis]KVH84670.1 carbohydrate kinase [Burkholderia ubonensis]KVM40395.1 carbohydrate kinase [Burkholderia ubonensis]
MRLLGIDLGTGSVKLVTLDPDGVERAVASEPYALSAPQPGWAEIAPQAWWDALVRAAARLPADERAQVAAIGFSGQMHGVVLIDAAGRAVRPALLWPDTRAARLAAAADWPDAPNPVAPGMAGPLLRWAAASEPAALRAARWAVQPKDWLRIALGGDVAADPSDACATALATPDGAWDAARLDALGLPRALFAPVRASTAPCGGLAAQAAAALGLPAGVPLATGAADTACAALGSGLVADGDALLTTGSGGQIVVLADRLPAARRGLHRYRAAAGGGYYTMAAMQNVGLALEAVRGWLGYASWPAAYDDAFAQPASERLSFLPYLSGERSPWMNPDARGGWLGLGLGDTRGAMMRAAFEGVAFALRAGLDAIRAEGAEGAEGAERRAVASLRLAGGGSVDPRWRQLLADALGASLDALDCPNAATRGAALLAGVAIGHWREDALRALAPAASPVAAPCGDRALATRHARFVDLYARTAAWFTLDD